MERIKKKWNEAQKIEGFPDEFLTPGNYQVSGRYVLTEAGAATPSHDPLNGFRRSDGFPEDANGQNVNSRDYERNTDAQETTRKIAGEYNQRALQSPVIVSRDGIVLSGNGRTMAGILAAHYDTDTAYIEYLRKFGQRFGFTQEDVDTFRHPRLLFLADDDCEYSSKMFARFNLSDMKPESKTEMAISYGKQVSDEAFHRMIRIINQHDTLGDFYNNFKSATDALHELLSDDFLSDMGYGNLFDGDSISVEAREMIENVLIGKAFQSNPDAVRQITDIKCVKKNILTALAEISNNIALEDYSLEKETAYAIDLVYNAKMNGYSVADYARQPDIFTGETKSYVKDTTVIMLADMMNNEQSTKLKRLFAVYNAHAKDAANGQVDMFSGGVKSKEEILDDVKEVLNYSTKRLDDHLIGITEQRKHEARTSIFIEEAKRQSVQSHTVNTNVKIGDYCRLKLPNGETMVVKYEYLRGSEAGIRLKGWKRIFVPLSLLSQSSEKSLTIPDWWRDFICDYNDIVTLLSRANNGLLVA